MLSLIIMTGLTILFGPILAVFGILVNKAGSSALFRSLKRIQVVITEADAFLVLSIQVATIVRILQNPPIFEAAFLKFLNILLPLLILTTVFSQIAMNIEKTPRRATILCYAVAAYALSVVTMTTAGVPPGTFDIYQDVTEECHRSRGYENVSGYYNSSLKFLHNDKATKTIGITLAAFYVLFILVCGLPRFRKAVIWYMRKELSKSSKWGQLCAWQKPMVGAAFLCSICLGPGFYKLWITRALLAKSSGVLYQDNEWGFGQITAALLPAPIIVTAAHEVHGKLISTRFVNIIMVNFFTGAVFGRAERKETEEDRELLELHDRHYPG